MKSFNISAWALQHRSLVWYMMLVFVLAGIFSYQKLGREEDPSFTIKTMVVQAKWPGATIDDTAQQVTDRIEKKLQETPHLDYLRSYTRPGEATIFINLLESTPAKDVPITWQRVRNEVGDIAATLPAGVQGPFFDDQFGDVYGTIYAFTADGFTDRELRDYVEGVRNALLTIPDAGKAELIGAQDEKLYLEFDTHLLAGLGIDPSQVAQSLSAQNAVTPSGVIQTQSEKFAIRVSGAFRTEDDLARVNLYVGGRYFRLADIAKIRHGYADPPQPIFQYNGKKAIALALSMRSGGNNLAFGEAVKRKMAEATHHLPIGVEPHLVSDQPVVVQRAVAGFTEALWEAIAIVLGVSFLTLGFRAGLVVALTIPLVLAIVFLGMEIAGISLQRISLGALIIALGLLVDDAMITIEMMVSQLEAGVDRIKAATHAFVTTAFPMLTGTLVTVAGFVPVGFARSNAGEYCFSLFAVVVIALLVSWMVAVLFTPLIGVTLLPKTMHRHEEKPSRLNQAFHRILLAALHAKYWVIGGTFALFVASVVGFGFVQQQFFPASDRPELVVNLTLPQNASIYATDTAVGKFEALLKDDPDIDHYSIYVGQGAPRFILTLDVQLANDNFAQAVIVTKSMEARDRLRARLDATLPERFPEIVARSFPLELGPPVGWPLQYRISGPDTQGTLDAAAKAAQVLAAEPRTKLINFDWNEPGKSIHVRLDQDEVRRLGLSQQLVSQALNTVLTGATITQVRSGIYLVDVMARAKADERGTAATLRNLQVPLSDGRTVPLSQFVTFDYSVEPPIIWRRNLLPTVTVQADVIQGVEAKTVTAALAPHFTQLAKSLPPGYGVEVGGTEEASGKGMKSLVAVFPITLLLMATILMLQLQSFQRLFLVVSVAPLGLIGVVAALLPTHTPMGFVAILGTIALAGMIIRNSVILIDQIETNIATGQDPWHAVIDAANHRLRPILLTAAAAILGMLPIANEVFWGPMAYAVIGGLAVATALTLVFLPALYVAWFRVKEPLPEAMPQAAQISMLSEAHA
ncbi:MAG: family transporter [Rhodospirillales bacterium]|nr:family transporter [Rhodospirillales bacterium]